MRKNNNLKKSKKGDLTAQTLVIIILLIIGFALLLTFFFSVDWTRNIDEEVCHESVIFRATASQLTKQTMGGIIPLKCKTKKICLTTKYFGKGDCSKDFGIAEGITTVRVHSIDQLEKFYADEILSCWSMMGEGKISLFSEGILSKLGLGEVYPSCVICSRIAFDKDFDLNLEEMNLNMYLLTHKVKGKDYTYAQYLAGTNNIIDIKGAGDKSLDERLKQLDEKLDATTIIDVPEQKEEDLKKENAILFMQIETVNAKSAIDNTLNLIGVGAVGSFILAPVATTKLALSAVKGGWLTLAALAIAGIYQQGSVAHNRAITAGYCGDILLGEQSRIGCSAVRTTNYDIEGISQYCQNIESIP